MRSPTVAEYLAHQLQVCEKTQKRIAEEIGYENANVITMMKLGQTKVPLEKVPALATALGVDPVHFLRIAMTEYAPENWKVIQDVLGFVVTEHERELVEVARSATRGTDPRFAPERLREIGKLVKAGVCPPS